MRNWIDALQKHCVENGITIEDKPIIRASTPTKTELQKGEVALRITGKLASIAKSILALFVDKKPEFELEVSTGGKTTTFIKTTTEEEVVSFVEDRHAITVKLKVKL